ncbi:MAG: hypothetical protein K0R58_10 [Ramlibacter sp.]|nr:hypothetical protein [Ramlibacter sp.]
MTTTFTQRAMEAYYNRDPDELRRLAAEADHQVAQLQAYIAGNPAGPSSPPPDTGRSERENALADRPAIS